MSEVRNDGIENLLGALLIAGHFKIPEVSRSLYDHCSEIRVDAAILA